MTAPPTYTLRLNKPITKVFKRNTWDVYLSYPNGVDTYANRWVVETDEGYRLAYHNSRTGETDMFDPHPTKEQALEAMLALQIADKIEGKDLKIYPQGAAVWTHPEAPSK